MGPDERGGRGLSRERLVEAALGLIEEEGLDALSMRALADRLDVKAASIYWHVRDRAELLDLLAESILNSVRRPRGAGGWRARAVATAAALGDRLSAQNDAARVLVESPAALSRSDTFGDLRAQFVAAGLGPAEARDVALMAVAYVIGARGEVTEAEPSVGATAELAIDSGSRGVLVRAGGDDMETLVRLPADRSSAAPAVVRGEKVIVRRLRGVGRGELELNPRRPWRFHVQAPTWNIVLELGGLDVRSVHIDSGAANVEIFLPRPRGVVPIQVSGGVVRVVLHRPRGVAAVAQLSTGVVQVKLDDFSTRATVSDTQWESDDASTSADRYELRIAGGAVKVSLDSYALRAARAGRPLEPAGTASAASAIDILLDGVEARVAARRRGGR